MSPHTIGLIEDHQEEVQTYRRAFAHVATIRHWKTGEQFRNDLINDPPLLGDLSLLLVDLRLPGIGGVDLIKAVRSLPGGDRLPLVAFTGSFAEHDILRALDAGATEYEVKPSSLADLQATVTRCAALIAASARE